MTRRELIHGLLDGDMEEEIFACWTDEDFNEHLFRICIVDADTISIQEIKENE